MKKERPILMSTPMVQAILARRKSQTRRTKGLERFSEEAGEFGWSLEGVDENPTVIVGQYANGEPKLKGRFGCWAFFHWTGPGDIHIGVKCPYGTIGDVLWVRETWRWVEGFAGSGWYDFKASNEDPLTSWKPSIHMPKEASRIWLEITDIRVERVQDISEADAIAEGIELCELPFDSAYSWGDGIYCDKASGAYRNLWEHINGPESWQANPWVWVIQFKILSTTGKPDMI